MCAWQVLYQQGHLISLPHSSLFSCLHMLMSVTESTKHAAVEDTDRHRNQIPQASDFSINPVAAQTIPCK